MDEKLESLLMKILESQNQTNTRLNKTNSRLDSLENEVRKINIKIDNEIIPTIMATLDGYKANSEHISILDDKIDRLQVDVNSLSMKTTSNDTRIIELSRDLRKAK